MTKKNEIEILSAAVAALGNNSYCSQWLADQLPAIKAAMDSDMHPEVRAMTFTQTLEASRRVRGDAQAEADKIIEDAKLNAERLVKLARAQVADIKRRAIADFTAL